MSFGMTKQEARLLDFIKRQSAVNACPTFAEMMAFLDLRSKQGVSRILNGLEERGHIRRLKNRARAIEVVSQDQPFIRPDVVMLLLNYTDGTQLLMHEVVEKAIREYIAAHPREPR